MNILIIEDELPNFNRTQKILKRQFTNVTVEGPLVSISQVREHFAENPKHDLVLADIRLTDGLVFEAFSEIQMAVPVIFVTAYDEFALQAFKYNSVDYLLKPIDENELDKAIRQAMKMNALMQQDSLASLSAIGTSGYRKRFLCPHKDGLVIIRANDINHISLDNSIVRIHLFNGDSYAVDQTMDELESQLDPGTFFRANRQYIIHIDSIHTLTNSWNRKLKAHLVNYPKAEVMVSKEKASGLKKWLDR